MESDNVPVVIVAGGLGTRMKPFSDVLPKPLLMYQDQPMIKNVLDNFSVRGFRHFIILLHHQAQMIRTYLDYINTGWQIDYFYENEPLGTAGGLFLLKEHITDNFIVCNCDNLGLFDYDNALSNHYKKNLDITVFVKKIHYQVPLGIVHCDPSGLVSLVEEKPFRDFYFSTGIHIINRRVLMQLPKTFPVIGMPELINQLSAKKRVGYFDVGESFWADMSIL